MIFPRVLGLICLLTILGCASVEKLSSSEIGPPVERQPGSLTRPTTFDYDKIESLALDSILKPEDKKMASEVVLPATEKFLSTFAPVIQPIQLIESAIDEGNLPTAVRHLMSFRLRVFHRGSDPLTLTPEELQAAILTVEKSVPEVFNFTPDETLKTVKFLNDRYSKHIGFESAALYTSGAISKVDEDKLNQVFHAAAKAMRTLSLVRDGRYRASVVEIVKVQNAIDWWRFLYGNLSIEKLADRLKLQPESSQALLKMYSTNQDLISSICRKSKLDCY